MKKCIFCNLGQDGLLFPSSLNRYGPITITERRRSRRRDSNGEIFRPYLACEKNDEIQPSQEKRTKRITCAVTDNLGVGFSEIFTATDVVDRHGIFWAHEACLVWNRSNFRNNSKMDDVDHVESIEENLKQVGNLRSSVSHFKILPHANSFKIN